MTASSDGILKFWKKQHIGIEFVTKYQAYQGTFLQMVVSQDGNFLATLGLDEEEKPLIRIYDIENFD